MNEQLLLNKTALDKLRFRMADENDIPAIVELLKLGLGESLLPKSENFWRWKHFENPFGKSFIMLATDDSGIVGVRSFMRWQWKTRTMLLESVRGVDTVVHPNYQRQGMFGKLTLALARYSRSQGIDFLFSTPNNGSNKAYTKLGWREAGRLPVNIKIVRPFSMAFKLVYKPAAYPLPEKAGDGSVSHYLNHQGLRALLAANDLLQGTDIISAHTADSLRWRYQNVPVARYYAIAIERQGMLKALLFYRIKHSRAGRELRVTDTFVEKAAYGRELGQLLKKAAIEQQVEYITSGSFGLDNITPGWLALPKRELGPIVTIHNIAMSDVTPFIGFTRWSPSLGDLELF